VRGFAASVENLSAAAQSAEGATKTG
jgi:hypothetical protein